MSFVDFLALADVFGVLNRDCLVNFNLNGGRRTDILLLNRSLAFLLIWDIHHTALSIFKKFYILIIQHRW